MAMTPAQIFSRSRPGGATVRTPPPPGFNYGAVATPPGGGGGGGLPGMPSPADIWGIARKRLEQAAKEKEARAAREAESYQQQKMLSRGYRYVPGQGWSASTPGGSAGFTPTRAAARPMTRESSPYGDQMQRLDLAARRAEVGAMTGAAPKKWVQGSGIVAGWSPDPLAMTGAQRRVHLPGSAIMSGGGGGDDYSRRLGRV